MSEQQNEWPTREQMNRVQEMAADGVTIKVERGRGDVMRLTFGAYGHARHIDADGEDVTARETRPTTLDGVSIPLDVVKGVLGAEVVEAAVTRALEAGSEHPSYRVGNAIGTAFIDAVRVLVGLVEEMETPS